MSAIAGVYLLDGRLVDEKDLKQMNDSMPHRGPDGSGLWHDGPVGLAHQMLWTTPESLHEKLPMEEDGLVITSDSRIDNRDELLSELELSEEVSDSEVVLKAYGQWGKNCVDKLLGDFAFVIWDKAKEELFCARDHMGVRPFYYYYQRGKIFVFATEIKALFAWEIPKAIKEVAIGYYLARTADNREITFYQDVLRLPSASYLIIGPKSIHIERYWKLNPQKEIIFDSDEEYEKTFRNIFREAVRCRLRSAFTVGSMLSGGLDSSSIVCTARKFMVDEAPLNTFSIIFNDVKQCDERKYMDSVLSGGKLKAHYIYGDKIGPLTDIKKIQWHEDQPFPGFNLFLHWALYKEASKQSVRVLLDGIDGDATVFHGLAYITELAGEGRLSSMIKEIMGVSRKFYRSPWEVFLRYSLYPFVPNAMIKILRILYRQRGHFEIANPDFIKRIGLKSLKVHSQGPKLRLPKTVKEEHLQALDWGGYQLLMEVNNMAASAFSVEPRYPFFDKRLVEYCLALPPNQIIFEGWTRWIMRRALIDDLPQKIFYRGDKSDLSPNFVYGLLTFHKKILEDIIFTEKSVLDDYVSNRRLRKSYKRLILKGKQQTDDAMSIWLAANLALWLKSANLDCTPDSRQ